MQQKYKDLALVLTGVVLYDAMASVTARILDLPFPYFAVGSLMIFFGAPFVLAWRHGSMTGILSGVLLGLTDSTIGLAIAFLIAPPGFAERMPYRIEAIVVIVAFVTVEAGVIGLISTGLARLIKKRLEGQGRVLNTSGPSDLPRLTKR